MDVLHVNGCYPEPVFPTEVFSNRTDLAVVTPSYNNLNNYFNQQLLKNQAKYPSLPTF